MSVTNFRPFLALIFGIFLATWFFLVVLPWSSYGHLAPITEEGSSDIKPWDVSGAAHAGEAVYAVNGCAYCHTQQVRPASSGADIIRGWGTATDNGDATKTVIRRSNPRDYIWQKQVFLGNSRSGADLSNVGHRFTTAAALYRYLYDPYVLNGHSSMPAYKFLFIKQRITGAPAEDALVLEAKDAPPAGWEIVPTAEARSLVAYLLSLNKGYNLPDENGPVFRNAGL